MSISRIRRLGLGILMGTLAFGMTIYANPNKEIYGKVNSENVTIKYAPNEIGLDMAEIDHGEIIRLGDQVDGFTEVILEDDRKGYIANQYIDEHTEEYIQEPEKEKGQEVVDFALQYVGNPYKYGGNSLTNGADCSGFTSQVYKNFGINIQRSSGAQFSSNGTRVAKADLKAGDLVFYGYNGKVTHVAIYMGDNKIVHAGTAKTGIHVSPFEQRGMAPYMGAKRLV